MSRHEELPERPEALTSSLPRTSSIADFSKLFSTRREAARKSQARRSLSFARSSDAYGSEDSQVLYMKSHKRSRARDRSLSCVSNGSNRRLDGSSDTKDDMKDDKVEDELSWGIIDREIFEWQYVCQTGRPFWWSPDAKYHRLKKLSPRLTNEPSPRTWLNEIDGRPEPAYGVQRRAVSDGFLSDSRTVHDLAHLVAIQLLGACFTLPPDSIVGLPSPNYEKMGKSRSKNSPDPRMISSLRMHTNFRYSPSFGHEPRNTSPVVHWGPYDGPSRASSPSVPSTGAVSPDIGTSRSPSRRLRLHRRALHVTEGSGPIGSHDEDQGSTVAMTGPRKRSEIHDATCKPIKTRHSKSVALPVDSGSPSQDNRQPAGGNRHVQTSQQQPNMNYRLQPTILSEPHHVFVQPVRELVVKRWRSFRRRFGGSLHSALPASHSDYPTSGSESGASEVSSAVLSSDARKRRRRARERGEIHSSSVDSTPHYNSPASPYSMDHQTVTRLAEHANSVSSPFPATSSVPSGQPFMETALPSEISLRGLSHQASSVSENYGSSPSISSPASSKAVSPPSSLSYSPRRIVSRKRRQSLLSEVFMPEDLDTPASVSQENTPNELVERNLITIAGSTLPTPTEENPAPSYPETSKQGLHSSTTTPSWPGYVASSELKRIGIQERPPLSRTSSSGTQVFTPGSDGVEVDGLPTGPDRSPWAKTGGRRERTYLL